MPVNITNCVFDNVGTIVKSDADTAVTMKDSKAVNITDHAFILTPNSDLGVDGSSFNQLHKAMIHIRDADFLDRVGLSQDTDTQKLKELLLDLREKPEHQQRKIISDSFLSRSSNLTTITANILQILPYVSF